jgi:hypothetical protein
LSLLRWSEGKSISNGDNTFSDSPSSNGLWGNHSFKNLHASSSVGIEAPIVHQGRGVAGIGKRRINGDVGLRCSFLRCQDQANALYNRVTTWFAKAIGSQRQRCSTPLLARIP